MQIGDTFFLSLWDGGSHLYFICTKPDVDGKIAIVAATSRLANSDLSCCLAAGEHPRITHASVIHYKGETVRPIAPLEAALLRGQISLQGQAEPAVIKKIRDGALVSIHSSGLLRDAIQRCSWSPS